MKYRNVLAATALIGMMAITGCSRGALAENNEGNYNGERLVRSVTRNNDGTTRGFTRGITRNNTNRTTQNRYTGIRETDNNGDFSRGIDRQRGINTRDITNNRNTRGLGRNYVYDRTHRSGTPEYALNDRLDNQQTVPVIALDNHTEDDTTAGVAEFFAARRNRNRAPETQTEPATQPGSTPESDNYYDYEESDNAPEEPETTPEPTEQPANQAPEVKRIMK